MTSTMICVTCNDEITDRAMKAGEKLYHEDHFLCCVCNTGLKTVAVYTKNDQLYCEADYMSKFVPVCARCQEYITQVCTHHAIPYPSLYTVGVCKSHGQDMAPSTFPMLWLLSPVLWQYELQGEGRPSLLRQLLHRHGAPQVRRLWQTNHGQGTQGFWCSVACWLLCVCGE